MTRKRAQHVSFIARFAEQDTKRHESGVEAEQLAPERRLAGAFVKVETKSLGEPVGVARECAEQNASDEDVMEVRNQEQAVVEHEVVGGTASSTPVMPPVMNVTVKPGHVFRVSE
jgi:hypothetical protein